MECITYSRPLCLDLLTLPLCSHMYVAPLFTHVRGVRRYDPIAFNYAINNDKSRKLLVPGTGRLLAPINNQQDYWLQQTYFI